MTEKTTFNHDILYSTSSDLLKSHRGQGLQEGNRKDDGQKLDVQYASTGIFLR